MLWGLAWWLGAGLTEIDRVHRPAHELVAAGAHGRNDLVRVRVLAHADNAAFGCNFASPLHDPADRLRFGRIKVDNDGFHAAGVQVLLKLLPPTALSEDMQVAQVVERRSEPLWRLSRRRRRRVAGGRVKQTHAKRLRHDGCVLLRTVTRAERAARPSASIGAFGSDLLRVRHNASLGIGEGARAVSGTDWCRPPTPRRDRGVVLLRNASIFGDVTDNHGTVRIKPIGRWQVPRRGLETGKGRNRVVADPGHA